MKEWLPVRQAQIMKEGKKKNGGNNSKKRRQFYKKTYWWKRKSDIIKSGIPSILKQMHLSDKYKGAFLV